MKSPQKDSTNTLAKQRIFSISKAVGLYKAGRRPSFLGQQVHFPKGEQRNSWVTLWLFNIAKENHHFK
jgi:hypothetical protein